MESEIGRLAAKGRSGHSKKKSRSGGGLQKRLSWRLKAWLPNAGPLRELHAEGTAAAAGALDVGVVELEASAFESFDVVDFDTIKIHRTHLVNGDLEAIEVHDLVVFIGLILKRHVVLETGAAAADHSNAKSGRDRALHIHDFLDLTGGNGRQIDHNPMGLHGQNYLRRQYNTDPRAALAGPESGPSKLNTCNRSLRQEKQVRIRRMRL